MKILADLHIHSKYSRAVSQEMALPQIAQWAKKKGIDLIATGDWTHPLWLREIKANLEEVGSGVYGIKGTKEPLFVLSTEISSIYSQGGRLHRIHNVILAPSLAVVEKINKALVARGANLMSDGRPVTGIPAEELVKLVLTVDENSLFIPAHVWTPWFSLYGSESGFDSINECFGEMAKYIFGVETGLSSDPAMNWRIKELDTRSIISSSDAHSGPKMGREATIFDLEEVTFGHLREAIVKQKIAYTLEFYPEEGKYHFSGHRDCKVRQSPKETAKLGETCPVCGKHLTIGVMHRVDKLANREVKTESFKDQFGVRWIKNSERPERPPYAMLVPLQEILAESIGGLPTSPNVKNEYEKLTGQLGGEFKILLEKSPEEIAKVSGPKVAEGIKKVRTGEITVEPGYDGVFGVVKIWGDKNTENKQKESDSQMSLF